jgi:hypothetical protein
MCMGHDDAFELRKTTSVLYYGMPQEAHGV